MRPQRTRRPRAFTIVSLLIVGLVIVSMVLSSVVSLGGIQ
jgi:predicted nucleic acid-binding Zn ribbon protein